MILLSVWLKLLYLWFKFFSNILKYIYFIHSISKTNGNNSVNKLSILEIFLWKETKKLFSIQTIYETTNWIINNLFIFISVSTPKPSENISQNIPITDCDREILLAIGKIKRQKQRPSIDRLFNICNKIKEKFPQFSTKDGIESQLNDMINRQLLQKVDNEKGLMSYRELNSAIAIVAITNPKRSRAKPNVSVISEANDNKNLSLNSEESK